MTSRLMWRPLTPNARLTDGAQVKRALEQVLAMDTPMILERVHVEKLAIMAEVYDAHMLGERTKPSWAWGLDENSVKYIRPQTPLSSNPYRQLIEAINEHGKIIVNEGDGVTELR